MRMAVSPWNSREQPCGCTSDSADLQPSKDDVKFRRARDEAEPAADVFGAPETSEEEKQIARANRLLCEMTLRGGSLSEDWMPPCGAWERVAA